MINVTVTGTDVVSANLKKMDTRFVALVDRQIKISSAATLADAQRNAPVAFSNLKHSGKIIPEVNGMKVEFNANYAYFAEHGRKPGKRPPLQPILDWVHKKGLYQGRTIGAKAVTRKGNTATMLQQDRPIAFLIQRSIGKKGTKAHPFLMPAFNKEKPKFIAALKALV